MGSCLATPQEVALIDSRKAIGLFERVETPILGVIENMSYFQCPSDGKIYHLSLIHIYYFLQTHTNSAHPVPR